MLAHSACRPIRWGIPIPLRYVQCIGSIATWKFQVEQNIVAVRMRGFPQHLGHSGGGGLQCQIPLPFCGELFFRLFRRHHFRVWTYGVPLGGHARSIVPFFGLRRIARHVSTGFDEA